MNRNPPNQRVFFVFKTLRIYPVETQKRFDGLAARVARIGVEAVKATKQKRVGGCKGLAGRARMQPEKRDAMNQFSDWFVGFLVNFMAGRGINRNKLAKELGVGTQKVRIWLAKEFIPGRAVFLRIATKLNLRAKFLATWEIYFPRKSHVPTLVELASQAVLPDDPRFMWHPKILKAR